MVAVGIESMNAYGGQTCLDIRTLFDARGLDQSRFDNLLMEQKSVALPCEDPVTSAVNAAKPIVDALNGNERDRIEMVITSSESGLDFGKSLSTYIHEYLGLNRHCRLFEVKQACYGGTAALQMAATFIASDASPGAKVLVVASDVARIPEALAYAEPSQGIGAVAMIISDRPDVMTVDVGASGCYSFEVMDTCRPRPDMETGDPDLSLLSYLDCLENSFANYCEKVDAVDLDTTFSSLVFHTPFAGMVKGAHRNLLRRFGRLDGDGIDADFNQRVRPSLHYCMQVGNIYSAALYLALCSLIDHGEINHQQRIGLFSYGSGCSSEFFSGVIGPSSKERLSHMRIKEQLAGRFPLSMEAYDRLLSLNSQWPFGVKNQRVQRSDFAEIYEQQLEGRGYLVLTGISNFRREYAWS